MKNVEPVDDVAISRVRRDAIARGPGLSFAVVMLAPRQIPAEPARTCRPALGVPSSVLGVPLASSAGSPFVRDTIQAAMGESNKYIVT